MLEPSKTKCFCFTNTMSVLSNDIVKVWKEHYYVAYNIHPDMFWETLYAHRFLISDFFLKTSLGHIYVNTLLQANKLIKMTLPIGLLRPYRNKIVLFSLVARTICYGKVIKKFVLLRIMLGPKWQYGNLYFMFNWKTGNRRNT